MAGLSGFAKSSHSREFRNPTSCLGYRCLSLFESHTFRLSNSYGKLFKHTSSVPAVTALVLNTSQHMTFSLPAVTCCCPTIPRSGFLQVIYRRRKASDHIFRSKMRHAIPCHQAASLPPTQHSPRSVPDSHIFLLQRQIESSSGRSYQFRVKSRSQSGRQGYQSMYRREA